MNNNDTCKVVGCRFPKAHTTIGHMCGICKEYGHGQIECGDIAKINELKKYFNDKLHLSNQCTQIGCKYKWSHNYKSHNCHKCYKNHSSKDCIIQSIDEMNKRYPITTDHDYNSILKHLVLNDHMLVNGGYFETEPFAMGCKIFIKCEYSSSSVLHVSGIFMHPDNWGQYGKKADDRDVLNLFLGSCENITSQFNNYIKPTDIECPLCRTINKDEDVMPLKGCSEKCCVCLDKNVELYFKQCNHASVCLECYKKL